VRPSTPRPRRFRILLIYNVKAAGGCRNGTGPRVADGGRAVGVFDGDAPTDEGRASRAAAAGARAAAYRAAAWRGTPGRGRGRCDDAERCDQRGESGDHGLVTEWRARPRSGPKHVPELGRCRKLRQFDGSEPAT
jgi:hypothetical protein